MGEIVSTKSDPPHPPQGNGTLHSRRVDASLSSRWHLGWVIVGRLCLQGVIVAATGDGARLKTFRSEMESGEKKDKVAFMNA